MAPRGGGQSTREAGGARGGTPRVGFTVRADVRKRFILLSGAAGWSPAGAGGAVGGATATPRHSQLCPHRCKP